MEFHIFEESLI